jgi:hypothetical protein
MLIKSQMHRLGDVQHSICVSLCDGIRTTCIAKNVILSCEFIYLSSAKGHMSIMMMMLVIKEYNTYCRNRNKCFGSTTKLLQ